MAKIGGALANSNMVCVSDCHVRPDVMHNNAHFALIHCCMCILSLNFNSGTTKQTEALQRRESDRCLRMSAGLAWDALCCAL